MQPTTPDPQDVVRRAIATQAEQREHARVARLASERPWQLAFLGLLIGAFLGLIAWPGAPLDRKLSGVGYGICAQLHTQSMGGLTLPICARNTGIYTAFALTTITLLLLGRGRAGKIPSWPIVAVLTAFIIIMGIDGVNSLMIDLFLPHLYTPMNWLRTLTGAGMGISIGVLVLLIMNLALRRDVDDTQPILRGWGDLALLMLINGLMVVAIYANITMLFWPLAFLSTVGIVGVLFCINLLVVALLMQYEAQVTSLRQLARPAVVALFTTALMVGGMAYLRIWLEGQGMM